MNLFPTVSNFFYKLTWVSTDHPHCNFVATKIKGECGPRSQKRLWIPHLFDSQHSIHGGNFKSRVIIQPQLWNYVRLMHQQRDLQYGKGRHSNFSKLTMVNHNAKVRANSPWKRCYKHHDYAIYQTTLSTSPSPAAKWKLFKCNVYSHRQAKMLHKTFIFLSRFARGFQKCTSRGAFKWWVEPSRIKQRI